MKARYIIYTVIALYLALVVVAAVFVLKQEPESETTPAEHEASFQIDTQDTQIILDA